ncbi:hypothetical protein Baya_8311 [Bagarius yarrelli]|uniref:Uncharacterized protein n=1 Tax=Bagarius yarrelli TaxID=175774 RepID=A0A556U4M2_BAGYA|nr:hypothetical protein Baya_8311 [Bagarius yarrelli]
MRLFSVHRVSIVSETFDTLVSIKHHAGSGSAPQTACLYTRSSVTARHTHILMRTVLTFDYNRYSRQLSNGKVMREISEAERTVRFLLLASSSHLSFRSISSRPYPKSSSFRTVSEEQQLQDRILRAAASGPYTKPVEAVVASEPTVYEKQLQDRIRSDRILRAAASGPYPQSSSFRTVSEEQQLQDRIRRAAASGPYPKSSSFRTVSKDQ